MTHMGTAYGRAACEDCGSTNTDYVHTGEIVCHDCKHTGDPAPTI